MLCIAIIHKCLEFQNVQIEPITVVVSSTSPTPEPVGRIQAIVYVGLVVSIVALLISLLSHMVPK